MNNSNRGFAGGNDEDKLLPESSRSADEQVLWLGLGVVAILGLLFFGVTRCDGAADIVNNFPIGDATSTEVVIVDLLADDGSLGMSADFFSNGDLGADLGNTSAGPFTIFAPTDSAWNDAGSEFDLDIDEVFATLTDADRNDGIGFHVIDGEYTLSQLRSAGPVTTIGGYVLTFGDDDLINGQVSIATANLRAENGIVHKINGVFPVPVAIDAPAAEAE